MGNKQNKHRNLPLILVILDGWGLAPAGKGNAVSMSKTPTLDGLMRRYPNTTLYAHGKYVGLPISQVGNSEAGHMNIGAGRLVEQDAVLISKSISNGTFYKNSAFLGAIRHVHKMNSKMHVMGMLSNGQSPHSDPKHLLAMLALLKRNKINNVCLHLFTDGRDSPKYAALNLIDELDEKLSNKERIATVMGRFYAMDRKKKWERTEMAYNALTLGRGRQAVSAKEAIAESYNRGESDEFMEPYVIAQKDKYNTRIEEGDSVIFFNLRSDRGRQLTKVFVQHQFQKMNLGSFKRIKHFKHLFFVAMTDFGPDLDDNLAAFPGIDLNKTLPAALSEISQLYIAETEKYAHVTYFFNGGYSGTIANEVQRMISSPDVRSYDETPAMSSAKLVDYVVRNLHENSKKEWEYDFTVLNIAAPDMVGHTGNLKAGIKCCEQIDSLLKKLVKAYLNVNGTVIITADHGNIEKMLNPKTGEIYTEHTTNKVPFAIISKREKTNLKLVKNGVLGDIAPTILKLIGIKKPKEMKGRPLY